MKTKSATKRIIMFISLFFIIIIFNFQNVKGYDEEIASKIVAMTSHEADENEDENSPYISKRLIVKTYENINLMGAVEYVFDDGYYTLQYKNIEDTESAYLYYKSLKCIEGVSVDAVLEASSNETYTTWGAAAMGVDKYSNYLTSTIGVNNLEEIIVAVLDSGIDTDHEWFRNRIASGGKDFTGSTSSSGYEYEDRRGHGTHVSGIIADMTFDNVKILPIKVLGDDGKGYVSNTIEAIKYVVELKKQGKNIVAMNMSLGGELPVGELEHNRYSSVIQDAYDEGIISIVAAGNEGANVTGYAPANISRAITVSSVYQKEDIFGNRVFDYSYFTNYGSYVDVSAPGQEIYSAWLGGVIDEKSGTSMAAPHVSAAVALLLSDTLNDYTLQELENVLIDTSIDLGSTGWDSYFGYGMVNLEKAYISLMDDVIFSETESIHKEGFNLTLTSEESDAVIYYTTDGTDPSLTNGNSYSKPIYISKTVKVKAISYVFYKDRVIKQSKINYHNYYFNGYDLEESYEVTNDGVLIKYKGNLKELVVPSVINGVTINKIGDLAFVNSQLTRIKLPSTVLEIGNSSFSNSKSLQEIIAPSVTVIGNMAFNNCLGLSNIEETYFPKLETIGKNAFYDCKNLIEVLFPKLKIIKENAFYNCANLETFTAPLLEIIEESAFYNNYKLKEISTQNIKRLAGVDSDNMDNYIFGNCSSLEELRFPNIEIMGNKIFYNSSIKRIVIGDKLVSFDKPFDKSNKMTVYLYDHSLIEEYCEKNEINFQIIDKFTITNNLLEEKIINNTVLNNYLQIEAEGYDLKYSWFEMDEKGNYIDLNNNTSKLLIDEENAGKKYVVRVFNWDGKYIDSNISTVIYTELEIFDIVSTIIGKGSVYPSNNITVIEGSNAFIYFVPSKGYEVEYIEVDGVLLDEESLSEAVNNGYNFSNIKESHEITVTYTKKIYTIEYIRVVENTEEKEYYNVEYGNDLLVLVEEVNHYHIELVMIGNSYLTFSQIQDLINNGYTFNNVSSNQIIKVIFSIDKYEIKVTIGEDEDTYLVAYGSNYKFTYNLQEGYYIEQIYIDNVLLQEEDIESVIKNGYEFKNIENDHSIKINIDKIKYTITAIAYENGSITPNGDVVIEYGGSQKFEFVPNIGYQVSKILIDETEITGAVLQSAIENGYTFNSVKSNYKIEVIFEVEKFNIEAIVVGNGSIFPSGNVTVEYGQNQTFIVNIDLYHHIESITVGNVSLTKDEIDEVVNNGYTFENVVSDGLIIIEIKINTYTIIAKSGTNGTIYPRGEVVVEHDSMKKFTFTPIKGYEIDNIIVDGEVIGQDLIKDLSYNGYVFDKIKENHEIEVTYKLKNYKIEVVVKGSGVVTPSEEITLNHGESKSFVFTPSNNYKIFQIKVNEVKLNEDELLNVEKNGYSIESIDKDYIIEVTFDKVTYNIEATIEGNGTMTPSGNVKVKHGESQKFEISIDENSYISYIYINNNPLSKESIEKVLNDGYTFVDVKSNKSIRVIVREKIFTITSSSDSNGFISPQGDIKVKNKANQRFIFIPIKGYKVSSVLVDGEFLDNQTLDDVIKNGYLFENVIKDHTIHVSFEKNKYTINSSIQGQGSINPSGETEVYFNDDASYAFTPNEGYYIKDVLVNNESKGSISYFEFKNIERNHEIKVIFARKLFDIFVEIEGKGTITCEGSLNNVQYGASRVIVIEPEYGSKIDKVLINDVQTEVSENTITFENIQENINVKITFITEQVNGEEEIGGGGCSKADSGNVGDFLFIIFGLLIVAFPKKRIFKI